MIALDTNVIVRLITADDAGQVRRAEALVASGPVLLLTSVALESEWVLRSAYGYSPAQINRALRVVCGLRQVTVAEVDVVHLALQHYADGVDFADALHLAGARGCSAFATFDRRLGKRATGLRGTVPVVEP